MKNIAPNLGAPRHVEWYRSPPPAMTNVELRAMTSADFLFRSNESGEAFWYHNRWVTRNDLSVLQFVIE